MGWSSVLAQLASHNDDINRLAIKGYAIAFDSNYLVVRDIPYLDAAKNLKWGAIVAKLVFLDEVHVTQDDHQIFFAGSSPYQLDGEVVPNLADREATLPLSEASNDVVVQRRFSNKPMPAGSYADFFEKIEGYVTLISGPAIALHNANPLTYRSIDAPADSVFKVRDTLTSRAEITDLSAKFKNEKVAVLGVGGTGSYVLDFLVKTPIQELRIFDLDFFHVHNAFRSPGRLQIEELNRQKAEVYRDRYDNFRHGLSTSIKLIDASSTNDLDGVTFAFVCVDKGSSRAGIFDLLISKKIPFIDVGMGLHRRGEPLTGILRTSFFSAEDAEAARGVSSAELSDAPDQEYRVNIQTSELNALNASLAVIRYKQLKGFYLEDLAYDELLFDVSDLKIVGNAKNHEV